MAGSQQKYDITVKDLFTGSEEPLVEYFAGLVLRGVEPLNVEFNRIEMRSSDLVVKGLTDSGSVICHLEFQTTNDLKMHIRMLRYAIEIYDTYGKPAYQVLLYMGSCPVRMADGLSYDTGDLCRLDYKYKLVDIGSLSRESLKSARIPELYGLLPLAERETRKEKGESFLKECVNDIIESPIDFDEKQRTLVRAGIFAGLAFDNEAIDRAFEEAEKMFDIEQSAGYQRIIKKGIERGRQEGRLEGKKELAVDVAIRLLRKKFKGIPTQYLERIKSQDVVTLETIAENIFDIEKPEDLDQYLS
ncbi:MAG TPA: DUF4351 domain-containing protein [Firmicutes bacterium]|nr:DUF4351 domain-containing protein [Bacillota bacterium]